jgi:hypothetical protein
MGAEGLITMGTAVLVAVNRVVITDVDCENLTEVLMEVCTTIQLTESIHSFSVYLGGLFKTTIL